MDANRVVKLEDYQPFPFRIPFINLEVIIKEERVLVSNLMRVEPFQKSNNPLILQGINLELVEVSVDRLKLSQDEYELIPEGLIVSKIPDKPFYLKIKNKINPYQNTSLEGLYFSDGMITSQCEAEGFRRITFHPDRPDVLSKYRVRIEADINKYPNLLSNGNLLHSSRLISNNQRHEVLWEDPFPKPSYLFALVAGNLEKVQDTYRTFSGKEILINIYVEDGNQRFTKHALKSLKKAMAWDEEVYGFEYDLGQYNIVAVRHFNMGAMENKSLNIFNSKLVLADSLIATDGELERVESVIAHEYFHNWTGNRITCRDWFQLSLKEGLTVFRDQCFTADLHSSALKRIEDVSLIRNVQFKEDCGPTSHAIKPDKYLAIDNFYTTTIYEKGAEVIRMLYILLGHKGFMLGMQLYVRLFDGLAATTEDFVEAIYNGASSSNLLNNFNMNQFQDWYYHSGTPLVTVNRNWDEDTCTLKLSFEQVLIRNGIKVKGKALVIPIKIAVITNKGKYGDEKLFVFDSLTQEFSISNLPKQKTTPVISIFRNFSAPVKWETDLKEDEQIYLLKYDDDPFSRWEALQNLYRKALISRASLNPELQLEEKIIQSLGQLIKDIKPDQYGLLASFLTLPSFSELESYFDVIDPIGLENARAFLRSFIGKNLSRPFWDLVYECSSSLDAKWPKGQYERRLTSICWELLASAGDLNIRKSVLKSITSNSMTLAKAALNALKKFDCPEREQALKLFFDRWNDRPEVLDTWFYFTAYISANDSYAKVKELFSHPLFDPMAPNAVRAVLGGFTSNIEAFHALNGQGYMFLSNEISLIDQRNPITASRLLKVFNFWKKYQSPNREMMLKAIEEMGDSKLSINTKEVIDLIKA